MCLNIEQTSFANSTTLLTLKIRHGNVAFYHHLSKCTELACQNWNIALKTRSGSWLIISVSSANCPFICLNILLTFDDTFTKKAKMQIWHTKKR